MGSDHSMHLQSCSADFQDEYCDVFENWSHAVRSIRGNVTGQKLQKAVHIDKNIRASLQQCWSMSNGQYPVFEKRFHGIKDRLLQDINQLEQIAGTA